MSDIGYFIRRSWRSAKIAIAAPGTTGEFRRSRRSAYKTARCVAGLTVGTNSLILQQDKYRLRIQQTATESVEI